MQNIRYHIINTCAVILFSYITAITINQFIKSTISPAYNVSSTMNKFVISKPVKKTFDEYKSILDSTFFKLAGDAEEPGNNENPVINESNELKDIQLLGTISGPASIARALIKKRGEKDSQIFKLWSDVYGFRLVRIDNAKIYLKKGEKVEILDMYAQKDNDRPGMPPDSPRFAPINSANNTQSISRSEIQQKVLNNVDNALKGLRAGPYRVNGNIEGYKLFRVSPGNILYKLGARSGDIVKRINGHAIDSTEKLLGLWQSVQGESKITVDIERGGKLENFVLNITD